MALNKCSFCGRSEKDVKLLINGLHGFICNDCAQQAYRIVMQSGIVSEEHTSSDNNKKINLKKVPKPQEIKKYLDEYIICLLYTSPSPRDLSTSRMPSSA